LVDCEFSISESSQIQVLGKKPKVKLQTLNAKSLYIPIQIRQEGMGKEQYQGIMQDKVFIKEHNGLFFH
jgi:hypothetical protein